MKTPAIFQWFWFNLKIFILFFVSVGLLVDIFPGFMLGLFGKWAQLLQAVGSKSAAELGSPGEMFRHILSMNAVTLAIYLVVGFLLQAPLVMPFTAAFYALVAFLAPWTMGAAFTFQDWLLVGVESLMLVFGASFTSALAGDLYEVQPRWGSLKDYWKIAWRKLWIRPLVPWKSVFRTWRLTLIWGLVVLIVMWFFVAWYETYGY